MSIRRLGIANRGEAALRCIRTVRALCGSGDRSLEAVVLYTPPDRAAPFVQLADAAVELPAEPGAEARAYLDAQAVIGALAEAGADAVWPGWGFLSEDADFARRVAEAGMLFLGPPPEVMRIVGDKIGAKRLAEAHGVPVADWSRRALTDLEEVEKEAQRIGLPVLVKASAGGGGGGIRVARHRDALADAYHSARSEAALAFGDDRVFVERLVPQARHVEVQIAGDVHGGLVSFGLRDCSTQRRNQKLLEEAPPPGVSDELARSIESAALRLARAAGYVGVGTVEFLLAGSDFFFLEVNPRLQVEHGVTELVTGTDLVALQIRIAEGASVPATRPAERGAAIEARVCAEDPDAEFLPAPGRVVRLELPSGPGIRVDTGVTVGARVPAAFDSLALKVLGWGRDREEARSRLVAALGALELVIEGGASNRHFLIELLEAEPFRSGRVDTAWVASRDARTGGRTTALPPALAAAAILRHLAVRRARRMRGEASRLAGREAGEADAGGIAVELSDGSGQHSLAVFQVDATLFRIELDGESTFAEFEPSAEHSGRLRAGSRCVRLLYACDDRSLRLEVDGVPFHLRLAGGGRIEAPSPGLVVRVDAAIGDRVEKGQVLAVLEAMKLELAIRAPAPGVVREVAIRRGQQVAAGAKLFAIEEADEGEEAEPLAPSAPRWGLPDPLGVDGDAELLHRELCGAMLGFDACDVRLQLLARGVRDGRGRGPDELHRLLETLRAFVDLERLFVRIPTPDLAGEAVSPRALFKRRLGSAAAGEDLPEAVAAHFEAAFRHYAGSDARPADRVETATRIAAAYRSREARLRLLASVLERVRGLANGDAAGSSRELDDRVAALEGLGDALPAELREAIWALRIEAATDRPAARLPASRPPPPRPLAGMQAFDLSTVAEEGALHCLAATHRDAPEDRRLVVLDAIGTRVEPARLADHLDRAILLLAQSARSAASRARFTLNRVCVSSQGSVGSVAFALRGWALARMRGLRHLGLDEVVVRVVGDSAESFVAEVVSVDPSGHAPSVLVRSEPDAPLAAADTASRRAALTRMRGLLTPSDVLSLILEGAGERGGDPAGRFERWDLATDTGRPARCDPATTTPDDPATGIVSGILTTPSECVPGGVERVLILSDPSVEMGALGPAECDRIVAALDLAEARRLPVEWVPVSSGARIAMHSGTENLDATARVVRRIIRFTQAGGTIHVVVNGVNVGAQSYFNALATMLPGTRGVLVMTTTGTMLLTGKQALDASGGVSGEDEFAIGGYEDVMGPNGEAQLFARDLPDAIRILRTHYELTYVPPGEARPPWRRTRDPVSRSVADSPYAIEDGSGFAAISDVFDGEKNPDRKRPFAIRALMQALVDQDAPRLERWAGWEGGETAVVWDARLGGHSICLIGIESHSLERLPPTPRDGPDRWTGATLFPGASRKIGRALDAASGQRPAVVLANLSGFDGSPDSLRQAQLEAGAWIARSVVGFEGPILFLVIGRYHGGAYVVFSRSLNPDLHADAIEGSFASVIGGAPAAAVVFRSAVRRRVEADPRAARLRRRHRERAIEASELARGLAELHWEKQTEIAEEFDAIHSVERARSVGSIEEIVSIDRMRPFLIGRIETALGEAPGSASGLRAPSRIADLDAERRQRRRGPRRRAPGTGSGTRTGGRG